MRLSNKQSFSGSSFKPFAKVLILIRCFYLVSNKFGQKFKFDFIINYRRHSINNYSFIAQFGDVAPKTTKCKYFGIPFKKQRILTIVFFIYISLTGFIQLTAKAKKIEEINWQNVLVHLFGCAFVHCLLPFINIQHICILYMSW